MAKKTAVVLLNLGGPDSKESIKPFLFNFFMDKNIIGAPKPIRWALAKYISIKRSKQEAGESYGELGDKSPLLENTNAQAVALQAKLPDHMKVFVSMRYWHPMSTQVIEQIKNWGAEQIVLLPLYPQFSTTTTNSSIEDWRKNSKALGLNIPVSTICCYPWQDGFIDASAASIEIEYNRAVAEMKKPPRILFSAHGLPEKVIKGGDPYQWQCEQSAEKIVARLEEKLGEKVDWQICYQSRVGPLKWIGPSTEEALHKAAQDGVSVLIYPHAFTQEHVETLVELDVEYREEAEKMGLKGYYRAQTIGVMDAFIDGLADMVNAYANKEGLRPDTGGRLCPKNFKKCAYDILAA
jgi:ferrochelatase